MLKLKIILFAIVFIFVLSRCGNKFDVINPSSPSETKNQRVNCDSTVASVDKSAELFKLLQSKLIGDVVGLIEMRNEGILIHPGEKRPTQVTFKLSKSYQKLIIRPFIATLPAKAVKIKEAGTVGVAFLLDGKSNQRLMVSRDCVPNQTLNLTGVDILTIEVDNADGKAWFDWFMINVVEFK